MVENSVWAHADGIYTIQWTVYIGNYYERTVLVTYDDQTWNVLSLLYTTRIYYYAGSTRIAMREVVEQNSTLYWLLTDHLGSQSITANADGSFYSEVRYTAFGETRYTSANDSPTDRLYTGQRLEEELGLYYYNARFYDAELAHFIQPDTVVPNPGSLLSYIRYAYVRFNPIRYTDPTGHMDYAGDGGCGGQWRYKPKYTTYILTGNQEWTEKEKDVIKNTVDKEKKKMGNLINSGARGGETYTDDEAFLIGIKGMIEFYRSSEYKTYVGWGGDKNKVTIYNLINTYGNNQTDYLEKYPGLLAHELGHVFRNSNPGAFPSFPSSDFNREDYGDVSNGYHGFMGGLGVGQFAITNINYPSEIIADMFFGWTDDAFWTDMKITDLGYRRYSYMNSTIRSILKKGW